MATTESANARFERLAEHFYADTGMLAPGKDDPTGHHSEADRRDAWRAWLDALREQERATAPDPTAPAPAAGAAADVLPDRTFEYLLNAMEAAGQSEHPARAGYAEKRRALFAYVADLQRRAAGEGRA